MPLNASGKCRGNRTLMLKLSLKNLTWILIFYVVRARSKFLAISKGTENSLKFVPRVGNGCSFTPSSWWFDLRPLGDPRKDIQFKYLSVVKLYFHEFLLNWIARLARSNPDGMSPTLVNPLRKNSANIFNPGPTSCNHLVANRQFSYFFLTILNSWKIWPLYKFIIFLPLNDEWVKIFTVASGKFGRMCTEEQKSAVQAIFTRFESGSSNI